MANDNRLGKIGWIDLTVPNADEVKSFYQQVANWDVEPVSMGDYDDYNMLAADANPAAGICHKSGPNANLPSQWLIYINVDDLDKSMRQCTTLGGKIIAETRTMGGYGRFCVIQDPAGAVAALFEPIK
jgi:predicted enzyme related to lactoylglutathione lyase